MSRSRTYSYGITFALLSLAVSACEQQHDLPPPNPPQTPTATEAPSSPPPSSPQPPPEQPRP